MMKPTYWSFLALMFACSTSTAENPTGACTAPSDGSRAGYHAANGLQWLPHCQNPLKREYWRVFVGNANTAATIPRLDGDPLLMPVCGDAQHKLHPLVKKYRLCQPASDQETVEVVNAMLPDEALALTLFLHSQLRFRAVEGKGSLNIAPYAIPSDVVDACKLRKDTQSSALIAVCEAVRASIKNGWEKSTGYGAAVPELVERLNELYGITVAE